MTQALDIIAATRQHLWKAGFRPVPIHNWDAKGPSPGKRPLGDNWRESALKDPPFCTTIPPVEFATNTGILGDRLRPIDIDVDDPGIANRIRAMAVDRFGEAPIRRRRNSPRCLLLYRAATGAPGKVAITGVMHTPGNSLKVEILGAGQQFVAFGRHDSGADLEWFPEAPGEIAADQLPAISEDAVLAFLREVAPLIGAEPPGYANGHARDHHAATDPQAEPLRVAAAMAAIPNTAPADWDAWTRIGLALWAATGGSAFGAELWDQWSKRHPKYNAEETEKRWQDFHDSKPTRIGAGTLFHMAGGTFHPEPDVPEPPPTPDDPGWWHSLEQSIVSDQPAPETPDFSGDAAETRAETQADARDGLVINPPVHWTAPAPLRQWLIDQWIPIGYVTGLYGDGGVGKSLLAQQLLSSTALALPWLGLTIRGGRAFGFMCEDDANELHRRQEGINRSCGVTMGNLENLRISARLGFDNLLMTFDQENRGKPTGLFGQMCEYLDKFRPRLVVLDTLADIFGGNEVNRSQARQFVQGVGGNIARRYECAVVIPAHPSLSGLANGTGTSGSTGWNNTFRSRIYVTRPNEDSDLRLVSRMKSNYAPAGGEITATYENGAFANTTPIKDRPELDWPDIEAIFAEIDRAWKAGDPWSSEPRARNHGRYIGLWASQHRGVNEKKVGKAVQAWLTEGYLRVEIIDTKAKLRGLRVLKVLQP
jgi:RecA-family ATPase